MNTSDRLTVAAIAQQEIHDAKRRPRRHRWGHMAQRLLVWHGPQLLFAAAVLVLLAMGWCAAADLCQGLIQ